MRDLCSHRRKKTSSSRRLTAAPRIHTNSMIFYLRTNLIKNQRVVREHVPDFFARTMSLLIAGPETSEHRVLYDKAGGALHAKLQQKRKHFRAPLHNNFLLCFAHMQLIDA